MGLHYLRPHAVTSNPLPLLFCTVIYCAWMMLCSHCIYYWPSQTPSLRSWQFCWGACESEQRATETSLEGNREEGMNTSFATRGFASRFCSYARALPNKTTSHAGYQTPGILKKFFTFLASLRIVGVLLVSLFVLSAILKYALTSVEEDTQAYYWASDFSLCICSVHALASHSTVCIQASQCCKGISLQYLVKRELQ